MISDSTQHDRRLAAEVGKPTHKRHEFSAEVSDYTWFHNSTNVIAHCLDGTIWLSVNEGYTWTQLKDIGGDFGDGHAMAVIPHKYEPSRAYLIARGQRIWVTMDYGQNWKPFDAPDLPNAMFIDVLGFHHENPDWLIWTGQFHCDSVVSPDCRARAWYSTDNGQYWKPIDEYVRTCTWPAKGHFPGKPSTIMCQSYKSKKGSQPTFNSNNNALELISGDQFYNPSYRRKIFDNVIDSATFSDFLLVGELRNKGTDLQMQVSLNGVDWAVPTFPPNMAPKSPAYTVLESRTKALFLHVTTHSNSGSEWGTLMKSNSNGSYYAISQEHVNRNSKGFVDFDKTQSLEGIAFLNVVTNPDSAALNKVKTLQTRVSHNDGGHWDLLDPPGLDSLGKSYDCVQKNCSLHLQSFTERPNPALSYTSPSAPGLILAVGNVGSKLGKWSDGDTFLSRDGGFVWEEVRKGAYMWEFGDQGNIIVMAADQKPTSKVIYTLDQGKAWSEYDFGEELIVTGIATVPEDVHRKFMLFGLTPKAAHKTIGIFLDFTHTEPRKCNRDPAHPENDDFELFSPSENRKEDCLFGTQTYYIRRKRQAKCYVGEELKNPHEIRKTCECTDVDFECEYNFARNSTGQCVQLPGTSLLPEDPYSQCSVKDSKGNLADQWFERTSVRKIPISKCEGGKRPDRGKAHDCPNRLRWAHGIFWWGSVLFAAVLLAGLVSFWWTQKAGNRGSGGRIRLPGSSSTPSGFSSGGPLSTLASVVPFLQGVGLIVFSKLYDLAESIPGLGRSRTRESFGYRSLSADADAEVLNDYDDDEEA
ncbi:vacuolar protein sorting/targeting protein PEP1 [Tilletia horrida]|uniref:Vacuolar protein sorting/targeting protein PEP1 n=1 Tax=Tilletia horrida TaxID=155126 RepID=A0AAN6GTL7_9BASI|nr:vacuolar protein sorting/targeting protein PEP1 [Tilletia horrida]KAK0569329.1 vacuolar protein sorting/targeting protein PEP1 [Tilletia horrida]